MTSRPPNRQALLLGLALASPGLAHATSPPNPCANLRDSPSDYLASYPPGSVLWDDSQVGVIVHGQHFDCLVLWTIEVDDGARVQRFEGRTDPTHNAFLVRPELQPGDVVTVRALGAPEPNAVARYTVEDSASRRDEPWDQTIDEPVGLYAQHRRGGVKVMSASFRTVDAPDGDDYARVVADDGTELGIVAPGWNLTSSTETDSIPKDGESGCISIEQRSPPGELLSQTELCGQYSVSDLRRCACSSTGGTGLGAAWLALGALWALRRRR